jgi:hypothetical protein
MKKRWFSPRRIDVNATEKHDASATATRALNRIADVDKSIYVMCRSIYVMSIVCATCLFLLTLGFSYAAWTVVSARNAISANLDKMELHRTGNSIEFRRK